MSLVTIPRAGMTLAGSAPMSREWYRWAYDITQRSGGVDALSNKQLEALWAAYEANGAPVAVQEEGAQVGIARRLNFVGAGVTVSLDGTTANVDIFGLAAYNEVEIDLGTIPKRQHKITITNPNIEPTTKVQVLPCGRPATGRGSDDWEWDGATFAALPLAGAMTVWATFSGLVMGKRMIQYALG